jgi:uncharacterized protein
MRFQVSPNPWAFMRPFSITEAAAVVSEWLERPQAIVLTPGVRHWEILASLLAAGQAVGPLVMGVHLAALAVEYSCIPATADRDVTRFPGLQVTNPLARL